MNSISRFNAFFLNFVGFRIFFRNLNIIEMNTTELEGNWEEQKGKLKQKFAALTENDLLFQEGMKEEMIGKLQIKLGTTKEDLLKIIENL